MARNISTAALTKLAQTHGNESVIMVDITWTLGGTPFRYAEKDVSAPSVSGVPVSVRGKIQDIGRVDSVVAISANETSEEFSLILDDTDGSIKDIIDNNDIMLRDVTMYQWFEGLNFEDRFIIFQGKINSPISWSETDRTVKFNVVSQLEDKSVGFSPDEGVFSDLPEDMIGKLWPECFGTSVHQKAIQVDFKHSGTLADPVGLADFTLPARIAATITIQQFLNGLGVLYAVAAGFAALLGLDQAQSQLEDKANGFFAQAGQKQQEVDDLNALYQEQLDTEVDQFRVLGGEHFPRGTIKLLINGAIFTGSFAGAQGAAGSDVFFISCADHPERKNFHRNVTPCGNTGCLTTTCKQFPSAEGFEIEQVNGDVLFVPTGTILGEQAGAFFAQGGTAVTMYTAEPIRYFVSITPGEVLKVAAFATFDNGERTLIDVPTSLYNVYTQSYGSVSVTVVQVHDALSKQNASWEDTLYVTYRSSVGPNTMDILAYLIGKYSELSIDQESFESCRADLENYPMHFCLTQKKNIITVLNELSFMARIALSIKSGKFFCKYLPARPNSEFTFNESNTRSQTIELGFTDTDELITELIATWRSHGAQNEDHKSVVRYNVKKYGIHSQTVDYYAYNYVSAVVKSLTFWINRRGHTWKKLQFQGFLDALNVETFDGVTLDFAGNYASNGPVLGCVEEATYNSEDNSLDFVVWTGVRSGDMEQFDLAYPQNVSTTLSFPDPAAEAAGFGGGDGPGNEATGEIGRVGNNQGVTVTFGEDDPYLDVVRRYQDRGSKKPSDVDDKNPGDPQTNPVGPINEGVGPPPTPSLTNTTIDNVGEVFFIDIRTTQIADSQNPGQVSTLDTFFSEITDATMKARTDATWKNTGGTEGEFAFKFVDDEGKFGAELAFLDDD
jgi:hypothetical protein